MKKLLHFVFTTVLFTSFVSAQDFVHEADEDDFPEWEVMIDSIFGLLDTAHITSGYHIDRGFFLYGPKDFNGQDSCLLVKNFGAYKSFVAGMATSSISASPPAPARIPSRGF